MQNLKKQNNQVNSKKETDAIKADKAIELLRYNVKILIYNFLKNFLFQKINAKNAFDIDVDFIESVSNIINKNEEAAWQKASASLDVSAKVYGYRVDSVHSETFKFLGGLNRNNKDEEEKEGPQEEEKEKEEEKKEVKIRRGQNTLETNINKLNLTKYDLETEVDPLFSVMTSKFNEISAERLLLNTIPLDLKLNYILESKEKKNEEENINKNKEGDDNKNKDNEEIKDIDLESEDSYDNLGVSKKKENSAVFGNIKDEKNPLHCSENMNTLSEEIKNVIYKFTNDNNIDDFVQSKICPDLAIFRESRELNIENNDLFLKYFKDEINNAEKLRPHEIGEQNGIQEEPEDIENQYDDGHMENAPDGSDNDIDPNDIKDIDEPSQENANLNNFNRPENVSMSLFKYDDLIEHSEKFGSGSIDVLRNLPQFKNFAKAFGKIDNKLFLNKNTILGLKKEGGKRKKEEVLFEFNEENEVDINTILYEPKTKSKHVSKGYDFSNDFENKRKMKCFYNYDKLSPFRLYTMNNKTIFSREVEGDLNMEDQEQRILDKIEDEGGDPGDGGDNGGFNEFEGEAGNEGMGRNNSFFQNEKEIEKNFGRLYRRFDVRNLKNKIWNNYENFFPNDNIDFKNVVTNMSKDMDEEELYSISTPTCFVCLLHLCNENNLYINQKDINTFYIEKDTNGEKSALASKTKNDVTKPKTKKSKKQKNKEDEMPIEE